MIEATFGEHASIAIQVARAESGARCGAVGDGNLKFVKDSVEYGASYGVFQIRYLKGRPAPSTLLDCQSNIKYAHGIFKAQGWKPWSVCRSKVKCY